MNDDDNLSDALDATALAYRGYNVTNLGRSRELLAQPAYRTTVERHLTEAGQICSDTILRRVDLVERVEQGRETTLDSFPEAIAIIMGMELAQLRLLEEHFGVQPSRARMAYGYSLGEVTALAAGGVFSLEDGLRVPLSMAEDCAALAADVSMGVVFSRDEALDVDAVKRLCLEINCEGRGVIAISSFLSPNTLLVLGQRDTVGRFQERMKTALPQRVHLRSNPHRWPPLHTPILWERNIPNRAGRIMHTIAGGFSVPRPRVLSLVTGRFSYTELNCREVMNHWIDHPQHLWEAIYETLSAGIETVIHVGPEPNLIPATFERLGKNVDQQTSERSLSGLGMRAASELARRKWLRALMPSRAALLRAPDVRHVILEDWLLEHAPG